MEEPIRVLMVIGCMGIGGAETMIMNLYRCIDRNKVQFDFLVHKGVTGEYESEIEDLGGKIYRIDKYKVINYFSYVRQLKEHFKSHPEHKIVHCHIGSSAAVCLKTAKKFGAYAIAHCHSTNGTKVNLHNILWNIVSYPTRNIADHFFTCSNEAAVKRYGEKIAKSNRCEVIFNGIDCEKFAFNPKCREAIQKEFDLCNCFVIGHVGRHALAKNPIFLLEVFAEVYRMDTSARLLQVGQGEMTEQMKQKCRELGIQEVVIFAGAHLDVEKYYSAMDVFVFPSVYEGLPLTLIEAQTNGLTIFASDTITNDVDLGLGAVHFLPLTQSNEKWAEEILKYKNATRRESADEMSRDSGWDSKDTVVKLERIYCEIYKKL